MTNIGTNVCYPNVRLHPELGTMGPIPMYVVRALSGANTCYRRRGGHPPREAGHGRHGHDHLSQRERRRRRHRHPRGRQHPVINCPNEPPAMVPVSCQPGLAGIGGMGGGATMCAANPMCR
jgi:hypothetical protein